MALRQGVSKGREAKLLVDCGNSRLKWGLLRADEIVSGVSLRSSNGITESDLNGIWADLNTPRQVWIANVAGQMVADRLNAWSRTHWRITPHFVRPLAEGYGVVNGYRYPETLGVDRWLAMIAVRHRYTLPACIVDCGTALTLDVLDQTGRHRGGLICPGLALMAETLMQDTAGVRFETPAGGERGSGLADHTGAAVYRGVRQAALGLIERTYDRYIQAEGPLSLVMTGGDAAELAPSLSVPLHLAPDLVLQGLAVVSR
ncbi:MAG: type III pantothenate kinase [Methylothermaceae bacterium]|nr:type III pantothenate kinase [Methylothermaceae bacterium]